MTPASKKGVRAPAQYSGDAGARINARLTPEVMRKVAYLAERTHQNTTMIVRESIERYYRAVREEEATPADLLATSGFVGCAEGPRDLSARYKEELGASLGKKA